MTASRNDIAMSRRFVATGMEKKAADAIAEAIVTYRIECERKRNMTAISSAQSKSNLKIYTWDVKMAITLAVICYSLMFVLFWNKFVG